MDTSSFREKLGRREPVAGCIIHERSPALVEICGLAGFDFVFIDAEHGPLSPRDCEELVRAAQVRGIVPLVRVPNTNSDTILRYLDIGAAGIIVPGLSTRQEAEAVVRAAKYAPSGCRGLAPVRAADYGMTKPLADYVAEANRETMVVAIIENSEAISNLSAILAVEGLDFVILGAADLSQSLGVPGQTNHPRVREAYGQYVSKGLKVGKPIGTVVRPGENAQEYLEAGLTVFLTIAYSLFGSAAKGFVSGLRHK